MTFFKALWSCGLDVYLGRTCFLFYIVSKFYRLISVVLSLLELLFWLRNLYSAVFIKSLFFLKFALMMVEA